MGDYCLHQAGSASVEPFRSARGHFACFDGRPVPEKCLNRILDRARPSPGDGYFQPSRWLVVRRTAGKQVAQSASYVEASLLTAPVVLICLADPSAWKTAPQRIQEMIAKRALSAENAHAILRKLRAQYASSPDFAQRAALAYAYFAVNQAFMAAAGCNLSPRWVSEFDEKRIKTYFHIPDHFLVAAIIGLGYTEEDLPRRPEPHPQAPAYYEEFGQLDPPAVG